MKPVDDLQRVWEQLAQAYRSIGGARDVLSDILAVVQANYRHGRVFEDVLQLDGNAVSDLNRVLEELSRTRRNLDSEMRRIDAIVESLAAGREHA